MAKKRYLSEKKVLKQLGIPDFRHMTKDKVVQFASMLHRMDPEVAKEAIDQFPEFKDMATELTNALKGMADEAFKSSEESQKYFYEACNKVIETLKEELQDDEIDAEERTTIRNQIIQVLQMIGDKDTEHKEFVQGIVKYTVLGIGVIVTAAAALLGGVFLLNPDDSDDVIEGDFSDEV